MCVSSPVSNHMIGLKVFVTDRNMHTVIYKHWIKAMDISLINENINPITKPCCVHFPDII